MIRQWIDLQVTSFDSGSRPDNKSAHTQLLLAFPVCGQSKSHYLRWWIFTLFVFMPAVIMLHCSIQAPEMQFTGEMTTLEREVLGTYEQMSEETWMLASTRSRESDEAALSAEKQRVMAAMRSQRYNRDDVDEFKGKGYVGETNSGRLVLRPSSIPRDNPDLLALVTDIVREENGDREVIMNRVIELNASLQKTDQKDVAAIFSKMYQENSPGGTWIETADGEWIRK